MFRHLMRGCYKEISLIAELDTGITMSQTEVSSYIRIVRVCRPCISHCTKSVWYRKWAASCFVWFNAKRSFSKRIFSQNKHGFCSYCECEGKIRYESEQIGRMHSTIMKIDTNTVNIIITVVYYCIIPSEMS